MPFAFSNHVIKCQDWDKKKPWDGNWRDHKAHGIHYHLFILPFSEIMFGAFSKRGRIGTRITSLGVDTGRIARRMLYDNLC